MMSVKVLLEVLVFSAWLQGLAFGLTQSDKLLKLEKDVQSQSNEIKYLKKRIKDMELHVDRFHPPTTCSALKKKYPSTTSGYNYINPQGLSTSPRVQVYCDMTSKNGAGVTEIGHSGYHNYIYGSLKGHESAGSYSRNIYYELSEEHIVAIIKQSKNCEQYIEYQCYGSLLLEGGFGWWVSRQGWRMNYWGGAAINSGKCACGMTNTCAGGGKCNCDKNDEKWRSDSGYLRDKNTLPVKQLRHGDTGGSDERAQYKLGKLKCWG